VYGAYGSPHLAAKLQAVQRPADPGQLDFATALARIESHLAQHPDDGRGWEVVAPVYMRLGRAEDAAKAYEAALRLIGSDAERLANYGEALVAVQDGIVPAEARAVFEKALDLDRSQQGQGAGRVQGAPRIVPGRGALGPCGAGADCPPGRHSVA
jgi:cytochrome c-type biogenesis protein CcmH